MSLVAGFVTDKGVLWGPMMAMSKVEMATVATTMETMKMMAFNEECDKDEEYSENEEDAEPQKVTKDTPVSETFVTSYYNFADNFTTNLKASKQFLQVSLGVSTQYDETVIENVEKHQMALRSEVLGTIGTFSVVEVEGKSGRDALAKKIQDAISFLTKGRTTLVIAHRLSTILNSDKIYVIDKGEVVSEGKHEELLISSELYKNFYQKQIRRS